MKPRRVLFYLVMAAALIAGLITGVRELYILFFAQLFLFLTAIGLNLWTILSFAYSQELSSKQAVKGAVPVLSIGIYNDKPFPLTMMTVEVETVSPKDRRSLLVNLDPKDHMKVDIPLSLPYRGEFLVGLTKIRIQDLFGLCPMRFDMRKLSYYRQQKLLVYPKTELLNPLHSRENDSMFFNGSLLKGSEEGESFAYTRLYRPGDSAKRIHWKASFRQQDLLTKQYDVPLETRCLVLLDNRKGGLEGEALLEYADLACECAADVIRYLLSLEHGVKALSCDTKGTGAEGVTRTDFDPIYDWLALLRFGGDAEPAQVLRNELNSGEVYSSLFIVSNTAGDELISELRNASVTGLSVTYLSAGELPFGMPEGVRTLTLRYGDDVAERLGEIL